MIAITALILALPQSEGAELPGLLRVPAGEVVAGVDVDVVEPLIKKDPASVDFLAAMTPEHEAQVGEFHIGPTEVTNEMYSHYVDATGAQPPVSWWQIDSDLRAAILKWGREENGQEWVFDESNQSKFWDRHWQDESWTYEDEEYALTLRMDPEMALFPVTWVNAEDAEAYCAWAGLRLPTEYEWMRAARGDEDWPYPFGEDFDRSRVAFNATEPRNLAAKLLPVNSLENASPVGAVDMAGNVWELVGTGFVEFPGFKGFEVKDGRRTIACFPNFDASAPTIKGGCYMVPDWATTIDMRVGTFSVARNGVTGFRFASSVHPTANAAVAARNELNTRTLGLTPDEAIDPETAIGVEKRFWAEPAELEKNRSKPSGGLPEPKIHPDYAVPDGYLVVTVVPLQELAYNRLNRIDKDVMDGHGPIPVAILHSTVPLGEPNLTPGTYILSYIPEVDVDDILELGAALPKRELDRLDDGLEKAKKKAAEDWTKKRTKIADELSRGNVDLSGVEIDPLDTREGALIVVDQDNKGVGFIELKRETDIERHKDDGNTVTINLETDRLDIEVQVPSSRRGRSFVFEIPLQPLGEGGSLVKEGYWDGDYLEVKEKRED